MRSPKLYQETDNPNLIQLLSAQGPLPSLALEHRNISAVLHSSWVQNVLAWGQMLELLPLTSSQYHIFNEDGCEMDIWRDLFFPGLAWLVYCLEAYYCRSQDAGKLDLFPELFDRQRDSVLQFWEIVAATLSSPAMLVSQTVLLECYVRLQTDKPLPEFFLPTFCRNSSFVIKRCLSSLPCE